MKIKYFQETDTLYLAFSDGEITETRELDENTLLDYLICLYFITIVPYSKRWDVLVHAFVGAVGLTLLPLLIVLRI